MAAAENDNHIEMDNYNKYDRIMPASDIENEAVIEMISI